MKKNGRIGCVFVTFFLIKDFVLNAILNWIISKIYFKACYFSGNEEGD